MFCIRHGSAASAVLLGGPLMTDRTTAQQLQIARYADLCTRCEQHLSADRQPDWQYESQGLAICGDCVTQDLTLLARVLTRSVKCQSN